MVIAFPLGSDVAAHAACVAAAAAQWAKRRRVKGAAQRRGRLILISSGSVYPAPLAGLDDEAADDPNGATLSVDERSVTGASARAASLLAAEEAVHARGGIALRLAGLYSAERGPHSAWLRRGELTRPCMGRVNLIHYDDAAAAVVAALLCDDVALPRVLLLSDGRTPPLTRRAICRAALRLPCARGKTLPAFRGEGETTPVSKAFDCSLARSRLAPWRPQFKSFKRFVTLRSARSGGAGAPLAPKAAAPTTRAGAKRAAGAAAGASRAARPAAKKARARRRG
jgi:nucleoside-diphosphate-sugar epimerase